MLLELAIVWSILGLLCDQIMARRAKREGRPYGLPHLATALLFGWLIVPLAFLIWVVLMVGWRGRQS